MVEAAKRAGADYVKLQRRNIYTFYSNSKLKEPYASPFGATFLDYRKQLELGEDDFAYVDAICEENSIKWFASALDIDSFEFFRNREHSLIKLPSTVSEHNELFEHAAATRTNVVISTGMLSRGRLIELLEKFSRTRTVYVLQCTSAYPTPPHDSNVSVVRTYRDLRRHFPQIRPGYSSHDDGAAASALAVAAGATMVEKHVKWGREPWAHFDEVALDLSTDEFTNYVRDVRRSELLCGQEEKRILESEHHKYWPLEEARQ